MKKSNNHKRWLRRGLIAAGTAAVLGGIWYVLTTVYVWVPVSIGNIAHFESREDITAFVNSCGLENKIVTLNETPTTVNVRIAAWRPRLDFQPNCAAATGVTIQTATPIGDRMITDLTSGRTFQLPNTTMASTDTTIASTMPSAPTGLEWAFSPARMADPGNAALLAGEVVNHNGCLAVKSRWDGELWIPVFPQDMIGRAAPNQIMQPGDRVYLGGSEATVIDSYTIPLSCYGINRYWGVAGTPRVATTFDTITDFAASGWLDSPPPGLGGFAYDYIRIRQVNLLAFADGREYLCEYLGESSPLTCLGVKLEIQGASMDGWPEYAVQPLPYDKSYRADRVDITIHRLGQGWSFAHFNEANTGIDVAAAEDREESESGILLSHEDYLQYQELKAEREFVTSPAYHEIQILSWQFARATLNSDKDAMCDLAVADLQIDVTGAGFNTKMDDLEFLILRDIRQRGDSIWASYEFLVPSESIYTYLTIEMIRVNDEYRVSFYAFER